MSVVGTGCQLILIAMTASKRVCNKKCDNADHSKGAHSKFKQLVVLWLVLVLSIACCTVSRILLIRISTVWITPIPSSRTAPSSLLLSSSLIRVPVCLTGASPIRIWIISIVFSLVALWVICPWRLTLIMVLWPFTSFPVFLCSFINLHISKNRWILQIVLLSLFRVTQNLISSLYSLELILVNQFNLFTSISLLIGVILLRQIIEAFLYVSIGSIHLDFKNGIAIHISICSSDRSKLSSEPSVKARVLVAKNEMIRERSWVSKWFQFWAHNLMFHRISTKVLVDNRVLPLQ